MIRNKNDYIEYLEADKRQLKRTRKKPRYSDLIWRYQIILRKCEYNYNCKNKKMIDKVYYMYLRYVKYKLAVKCGFWIENNVCGKGLSIAHIGPIIINGKAKIGENCRIHVGVNIGASAENSLDVPSIGNNVYIGPGAKIFGKIKIADNIAIGANSVVNKDFVESNISVAGVPAKKISDKGSKKIIREG